MFFTVATDSACRSHPKRLVDVPVSRSVSDRGSERDLSGASVVGSREADGVSASAGDLL